MVAKGVQIVAAGEAIVGRKRPAVRESLKTFALDRDEPPHTAVRIAGVVPAPIGSGVPCRTGVEAVGHLLHERAVDRISNALLKGGNRFRPIRSARRMIPFAAFGLKKYLSGTAPFSMSSHNEDAGARLGDSEVFAVKHTPSHAIPKVGQSPNDDCEISSVVGREEARNVFDDKNSGQVSSNQFSKLIKESRLFPFKPSSRPHSRQRYVLAGESSSPHV